MAIVGDEVRQNREVAIRKLDPFGHAAMTYVVQNDEILHGEPIIQGTRTPVRAIVETWRMGIAPEEIPKGMPHLSLGQVFGTLTYYCDHQDEINRYIEQNRIPDELIDPLVRNL